MLPHEKKKVDLIVDGEYIGNICLAYSKELPHTVEIHNEMKRITPRIFKVLLQRFAVVKKELKKAGITKIVTCNATLDQKLVKYWQMFGFTEFKFDLPEVEMYAEMEV